MCTKWRGKNGGENEDTDFAWSGECDLQSDYLATCWILCFILKKWW